MCLLVIKSVYLFFFNWVQVDSAVVINARQLLQKEVILFICFFSSDTFRANMKQMKITGKEGQQDRVKLVKVMYGLYLIYLGKWNPKYNHKINCKCKQDIYALK